MKKMALESIIQESIGLSINESKISFTSLVTTLIPSLFFSILVLLLFFYFFFFGTLKFFFMWLVLLQFQHSTFFSDLDLLLPFFHFLVLPLLEFFSKSLSLFSTLSVELLHFSFADFLSKDTITNITKFLFRIAYGVTDRSSHKLTIIW